MDTCERCVDVLGLVSGLILDTACGDGWRGRVSSDAKGVDGCEDGRVCTAGMTVVTPGVEVTSMRWGAPDEGVLAVAVLDCAEVPAGIATEGDVDAMLMVNVVIWVSQSLVPDERERKNLYNQHY
jgi:hypothetical protein